ncbi:ISAs1 family transposase [Bradyrhizobium sp. CB1650]|uniref:ISAs1 family transposase n=1 Tax=Bradyrhizobium sp. CB1650 TaxID=3039153 RepID=UPI002434DAB2|nr:ISAs1 family transposase [Bradyrhizobium sp. CB1650]WGD51043.1 ISAs1 family transposase [Bradyrhizobium sp. CB1650]
MRGAYERDGKAPPLHLVNVFAVEARMSLARQNATGRKDAAGALEVLELLSWTAVRRCTALQPGIARAVLQRGGDYALAIKANRGPIIKAVTQQFVRTGRRSSAAQIDPSSCDRHEARRATVMRVTSLETRQDFRMFVAVGCVTSRRRLRGRRAGAAVVRHYPSSKYISPERLLHVTRSHRPSRTSSIECSTFISPRTAPMPERTTLPTRAIIRNGALNAAVDEPLAPQVR